jgi:hypothetical protein
MSKVKRKGRYNIALNPNIHRAGHKLAKAQNRTFSNLLECLILQEETRLKNQTPVAKTA